jgi:ribosomal protein S18 acetylase RimI-like enzyme
MPSKEIVIRHYVSTDYPQVVALWATIGLGGAQRGDNQQMIEQSIAMGGCLLVVALPNGNIVGTSWITFDGRRLHLHHFGISKEYQRQGLGDLLCTETLRFAKSKGYQIKLEVHNTNSAAIALYQKHGFSYLGDYDVYIIRDFGAIL